MQPLDIVTLSTGRSVTADELREAQGVLYAAATPGSELVKYLPVIDACITKVIREMGKPVDTSVPVAE